ncbi:DUF3124 domain-containing protein [Trichlorobacter lovleyi]|uniref:DUF3124 domain-containing protein n=1 Tax=Trichlorobacter lovleyi (strain ATCC BAA-1151 / DSM 17278 / SZ) TaxID=398767 RepID=B3E4Z9_TRIL1|nr:DUF3124 domain-containing protein [Trichlorobacter lovleyi]ACD94564.1 conserved hypothetical protein [Trichlorobacter lovleyi SZ]
MMIEFKRSLVIFLVIGMVTASVNVSCASTYDAKLSKGQTVYVPAYSNVYSGPKKNPFQLATMLSIRNVDLTGSFKVTSIDYYDNDGRLIRRYAESPMNIGPLGSQHIYLEEKDTRGGFGANFIVRWSSDKTINAPIIECVMIGATGGQGISFVSPGQEIKE